MTTATRPAPPHGTRACYLRGCPRDECRDAHRRYCKRYGLRVLEGGGPIRVDLTPAAARVHTWHQQGYSQRQISEAAGTSPAVIQTLLAGSITALSPASAAGIMAARIEDAGPPAATRTDATGTRRRFQSLAYVGWPRSVVAERAGITAKTAAAAMRVEYVYHSTARAVATAFDTLAWQTPEQHGVAHWVADRARRWARQNLWYPPAAWDDDAIDDPAAEPDMGREVPRYVAIAEDAMWLERQDFTRAQVAERLGVSRDRVQQSLRLYHEAQKERETAPDTADVAGAAA